MILETKNLTKTFLSRKKNKQLAAISSLTIGPISCQSLVFIGPSGGGKSTLLRLLAGLLIPDEGTIRLDGTPLPADDASLQHYRRTIGIVFQSWNLFPHLSALENIVLPLHEVHGLSREEATERSLALLKRFDLAQHANKKPFELSGGQVQRVALIRAVAIQPKMLMLDEPTSALDPLMTAEVLELIVELKHESRDLILATHHIQFAKKIADVVCFVADGVIIEHGSVNELFDCPKSPLVKDYMDKILAY
jgi:polar amino acid transport system ATP-binding protein